MKILDTIKNTKYKTVSLSKGETLFHEEDLCKHVGIVTKGSLQSVSYLADGSEIVYNTIKVNQMFGNNLIFLNKPYYKGNIISNDDSEVLLIEKEQLITLLQSNKDFLIAFMNEEARFTIELNNAIKLLSLDNAKDRLLFYLHINADYITIKSVSDLAKRLYIKRETLSRLITKLSKENIIKRQSNSIELIRR